MVWGRSLLDRISAESLIFTSRCSSNFRSLETLVTKLFPFLSPSIPAGKTKTRAPRTAAAAAATAAKDPRRPPTACRRRRGSPTSSPWPRRAAATAAAAAAASRRSLLPGFRKGSSRPTASQPWRTHSARRRWSSSSSSNDSSSSSNSRTKMSR